MSRAARSILVFGIYLIGLGCSLLLKPNTMLALFGQPQTTEPWLRVVGIVVLVVGLYYVCAAREDVAPLFRWTTWARPLAFVILIGLVAAGVAPRFVVILGAIDAAGALWTWLALRADRRTARTGRPR